MKTITKKPASLILGLAVVVGLLFTTPLSASTMSSIDLMIELQEDGSAFITEERQMEVNDGTEIYIPMRHEPGSEITQFYVTENGVPYQERSPWDINASREAKAGFYGIHETEGVTELCWGIGSYGSKSFSVQYHISNVVRQLEDGQSFYWNIFSEGSNTPPQAMTYRIRAPWPLDENNSRIWAFGYPGDIQFDQGAIVGRSSQGFDSSHRVIPLVQFLDSPFAAEIPLSMTLAQQEDQAMQGSDYLQESSDAAGNSRGETFVNGMIATFVLVSLVGGALGRAKAPRKQTRIPRLVSRNRKRYYREIPYTDGPMTDVANIMSQVHGGDLQAYFNAYLLKWIQEGRIDHAVESKGFFNREYHRLQFRDGPRMTHPLERDLWNYSLAAAGSDGVLEEKEFTRWARKHYSELASWEKRLATESENALIQHGYMTREEMRSMGLFRTTKTSYSAQGEALADRIAQFRNYLKDFSLLNERGASHVHLWEELLVWAALYGIANQVAEEFQELYPEFVQESSISYADLFVLNHFAQSMNSGYHAGLNAASVRSSGAGGGSSIGGGGGSFGGGFGGGTR